MKELDNYHYDIAVTMVKRISLIKFSQNMHVKMYLLETTVQAKNRTVNVMNIMNIVLFFYFDEY